jgi:hypothetical protein
MLATLALTLLIAAPKAPTLSPEMARQMAIATQQYGPPPTPISELSKATGLYMTPTDDIWVYANASDPNKDEFLRAWGANGRAMPIPGDDPQAYSWSLLKWDLSGYSDKTKIVAAELILTAAPDAGYSAKDAAASPLEVRAVKPDFTESTWDYGLAEKYEPTGSEGQIFGSIAPANVSSSPFKITIDLMKGPENFSAYFEDALKKHKPLALAVTSSIDPGKLGRESIYKFYSKDAADVHVHPVLRIVLAQKAKGK